MKRVEPTRRTSTPRIRARWARPTTATRVPLTRTSEPTRAREETYTIRTTPDREATASEPALRATTVPLKMDALAGAAAASAITTTNNILFTARSPRLRPTTRESVGSGKTCDDPSISDSRAPTIPSRLQQPIGARIRSHAPNALLVHPPAR